MESLTISKEQFKFWEEIPEVVCERVIGEIETLGGNDPSLEETYPLFKQAMKDIGINLIVPELESLIVSDVELNKKVSAEKSEVVPLKDISKGGNMQNQVTVVRNYKLVRPGKTDLLFCDVEIVAGDVKFGFNGLRAFKGKTGNINVYEASTVKTLNDGRKFENKHYSVPQVVIETVREFAKTLLV